MAEMFTTECANIEVKYLFDNQGTFQAGEPIHLTKGEVRRAEDGAVWRPRSPEDEAILAPGRDEFVVMSNTRYRLDLAPVRVILASFRGAVRW